MALALVVIEEHAGAAVHLRDDDALGAVDDEGAVRRHERHVAHVDVLLLDILDGLRLRLGIDVEHDQAQRHLQRRGIGHAALTALVDVVLGLLVLVLDEFELGGLREILDREDRLEHRLQALVRPLPAARVPEEKLVVRSLLHLDQVRHFADFLDVPEDLANPLAAGECLRHVDPQCSRPEDAEIRPWTVWSGLLLMSVPSKPASAARRRPLAPAPKRRSFQKRRNGPGP